MNCVNDFVPPSSESSRRGVPPGRPRAMRFRWHCAAALIALCVFLTACPSGIVALLPFIAGIAPNTVSAGGGALSVTISGRGFASAAVLVNGQPVTVTSVTSTAVDAIIPAPLTATPGTLTVVVVNVLPSGNLPSNSAVITVTSPATMPVLNITKSHTGTFMQGETGATYSITVSNVGNADSSGTVTVTEKLPSAGLSVTGMAGNGWTCDLSSVTCTISTSLAPGASYPTITVTVNVATNAPSSVTNMAGVSGGGSDPSTASDQTTITSPTAPALAINVATSSPTFPPGGTGAYTITVSNNGTAATSGTVTVTIALASSETPGSLTGTGWTCTLSSLTCTISTSLAPGSSFNTITLQVAIATNAPSSVTATFTVSGGGSASATTQVTTPT